MNYSSSGKSVIQFFIIRFQFSVNAAAVPWQSLCNHYSSIIEGFLSDKNINRRRTMHNQFVLRRRKPKTILYKKQNLGSQKCLHPLFYVVASKWFNIYATLAIKKSLHISMFLSVSVNTERKNCCKQSTLIESVKISASKSDWSDYIKMRCGMQFLSKRSDSTLKIVC